MKPELFHRWYDPSSTRIRDYLHDHGIEHMVEYVDVENEDDFGVSRLIQLTGGEEVPCLITDDRQISGEEEICHWLRDHLEGQGEASLS